MSETAMAGWFLSNHRHPKIFDFRGNFAKDRYLIADLDILRWCLKEDQKSRVASKNLRHGCLDAFLGLTFHNDWVKTSIHFKMWLNLPTICWITRDSMLWINLREISPKKIWKPIWSARWRLINRNKKSYIRNLVELYISKTAKRRKA
jgi:hypothetical protein